MHAKPIILDKTNKEDCSRSFDGVNCPPYLWAVGTRRVRSIEEMDRSISEMIWLGGKWNTFGNCLLENSVEKVLWFADFWRIIYNSVIRMRTMFTINRNESANSRLKGTEQYKLMHCARFTVLDLVGLLNEMDEKRLRNFCSLLGRQRSSVPLWQRTPRKRKQKCDATLIIDG